MLTVNNVSFYREGNTILDGVSFSIQQGEYIGLIGPNGAGKTSLLRLLLGLLRPASGNIMFESTTQIGYVPQTYNLSTVVPISVAEVLAMSGVKSLQEQRHYLKKVDLDAHYVRKNFHRLSGGEQQRVIIARALCVQPAMLIIDEPLNGVDYKTKQSIYNLLLDLNKKNGLTILFASHEVDAIVSQCDHVLCLNKTLHDGCEPMAFAQGIITDCPVLDHVAETVPVHYHKEKDAACSC